MRHSEEVYHVPIINRNDDFEIAPSMLTSNQGVRAQLRRQHLPDWDAVYHPLWDALQYSL